jgi:pimeloyl-ACP methyl ester carboxylesterase
MSTTSASITSSLPKSPRRNKRKTTGKDTQAPSAVEASSSAQSARRQSKLLLDVALDGTPGHAQSSAAFSNSPGANGKGTLAISAIEDRERQSDYDNRLTYKIWELATTNANPAVDLLVCLERRQPIGFRYVDITRTVVIHHGSRDTRVPVDNVRWLGKTMRRCEVRVLEGEGHGLMASAVVMGNVLTEIAKEWEDWTTIVQGKLDGRRATVNHSSRPGIVI